MSWFCFKLGHVLACQGQQVAVDFLLVLIGGGERSRWRPLWKGGAHVTEELWGWSGQDNAMVSLD